MDRYISYYLLIVTCCLIISCGYHLRGFNNTSYKFPFKKIYLDCDAVVICKNIQNVITNEDLAMLATNKQNADVILKVYDEQTTRNAQGFNSVGRISSYILSYQVNLKILSNSQDVKAIIPIYSQIIMSYNDATVLSNNEQESKFWDLLHNEATNQLIRRIVYFKVDKK